MKLFGFLDTRASAAFAQEISLEFSRNYPADAGGEPKSAPRLAHAIEVLANRAAKFDRDQPLGWYRKAKFGQAIKRDLLGKGYDAELVDQVVYAAVIRMARRG